MEGVRTARKTPSHHKRLRSASKPYVSVSSLMMPNTMMIAAIPPAKNVPKLLHLADKRTTKE